MALAAIVLAAHLGFVSDPAVREIFGQLLAEARFGFSRAEEAAFIVRAKDGGYRCIAWPSDGLVDSARWEGRIPDGVLAIVHTHPNWMAAPSRIDARTARRSGVPVYVITRTQIAVTHGGPAQVVVSGEWKPRTSSRPCLPLARIAVSARVDRDPPPADFHQVEIPSR